MSFINNKNYYKHCLVYSPTVTALPGAISYISGACSCSPNEFLYWLLVSAFPAHVIGSGLATILHTSIPKDTRKNMLYLALTILGSFIVFASILWFYPQKRITFYLTGFLHGPIYDHYIPQDFGIIIARLSHLFFGLLLLTAPFTLYKKKLRSPIIFASLAVILRVLSLQWPSQDHGHSKLQEKLSEIYEHPHFRVHYQKPKSTAGQKAIDNFIVSTAFHLEELAFLRTQETKVIEIYVYPSNTKKKLWFGGDQTDITDVVTPSIHTTLGGFRHPTIRHELVHALTSTYGFYGLGFHPNMAITEGIAIAFAPDPRSFSLDEASAQLILTERLPDIDLLFSPLFWLESGGRSYTVAGSMLKFFMEKYGTNAIIEIYSGASFQEAFGKPQSEITNEWLEHIKSVASRSRKNLSAEKIFRSRGVLRDKCPHTKATYSSRSHHILTRIRQPQGWNPTNHYLPWLQALEPGSLQAQITLWKNQVQKIIIGNFELEGRLRPWLRAIEENKHWPPKTSEDVEMTILEADLLRITNQHNKSFSLLRQLKEIADQGLVGDGSIRKIYARMYLEENMDLEEAEIWRRYLAGWVSKAPKIRENSPWIAHYLTLRNNKNGRTSTLEYTLSILNKKAPKKIPATFITQWYASLGKTLAYFEQYNESANAFRKAANSANAGRKSFYQLESRRMLFIKNNL